MRTYLKFCERRYTCEHAHFTPLPQSQKGAMPVTEGSEEEDEEDIDFDDDDFEGEFFVSTLVLNLFDVPNPGTIASCFIPPPQ